MANKRLLFTLTETLNRIINWLFVFSLAFFLTPEKYGIVAVLISIEAMLAAILLGGFDRAAVRFISDATQKISEKTIFKLWFYLATVILILVLASIYYTEWNTRYYIDNSVLLVFFVALISLTISRIVAAISRANGDLTTFVLTKALSPIIKIAVFAMMLAADKPITESYFTAVGIGFLPSVIWPICKYFFKQNNKQKQASKFKSVYAYALPFLPHSIAGIILASIDRLMVNDMMGAYEAGIYNFSYMIGAGLSFVYAITAVTYERDLFASSEDKEKVNHLQHTYFYLLNHLSYMAIIAVFLLYMVLKYTQMDYATDEALNISIIVMLGYIINIHYLKSSYFLAVAKKTAFIAGITILTMLINVACNFILIPKFGVEGAAYATLLTYIVLSVLMTLTAKTKTNFNVVGKTQLYYCLLSILAVLLLLFHAKWVAILSALVAIVTLHKTIYGIKVIWLGKK